MYICIKYNIAKHVLTMGFLRIYGGVYYSQYTALYNYSVLLFIIKSSEPPQRTNCQLHQSADFVWPIKVIWLAYVMRDELYTWPRSICWRTDNQCVCSCHLDPVLRHVYPQLPRHRDMSVLLNLGKSTRLSSRQSYTAMRESVKWEYKEKHSTPSAPFARQRPRDIN